MKPVLLLAACAALSLPCVAFAQTSVTPAKGQTTLSFDIGTEAAFKPVLKGADRVVDLSALGLPSQTPIRIDQQSFRGVFNPPKTIGLAYGYAIEDGLELGASFGYVSATGKNPHHLGQIAGAFDIETDVSTFQAFRTELFVRKYLPHMHILGGTPYAAAAAGLTLIDSVVTDVRVPAAGISVKNARLYDKSTAGLFELQAGMLWPVNKRVAIGVEGGVRYVTNLKQNDSTLGRLGLSDLNDGTDTLVFPVKLRLQWLF